jgi:streptogrisin C
MGSLYSTTYMGTQSLYGDFLLLENSTYDPYVYSAGPTSNTALPVVDAAYAAPSAGVGLCSSGNTTGQICRYKIDVSDTCTNVSGVSSCHEIKMNSDQNLDGVKDCLGFAPGDSGGAVYNAAPGGIRGVGIISGESAGCPKWYYATSFYGIRTWNSSFHLLLH